MSTQDRESTIRRKTERAKKHVNDLKVRLRAYHDSMPYSVIAEDDPKTGDRVFHLRIRNAIPDDLVLIIGDAVQNLRTSLDHLANQLVIANGGTPSKNTAYPIGETLQKFEAMRDGKLKGMSHAAKNLIVATTPFQGGEDLFWLLNELNNVDKHRWVLAIARSNISAELPIAPADRTAFLAAGIQLNSIVIQVPTYPLQDGSEVHRILAAWRGSRMDNDPKLTFDVAFTEPHIVFGKSVVDTLDKLVVFVDGTIDKFVPLL